MESKTIKRRKCTPEPNSPSTMSSEHLNKRSRGLPARLVARSRIHYATKGLLKHLADATPTDRLRDWVGEFLEQTKIHLVLVLVAKEEPNKKYAVFYQESTEELLAAPQLIEASFDFDFKPKAIEHQRELLEEQLGLSVISDSCQCLGSMQPITEVFASPVRDNSFGDHKTDDVLLYSYERTVPKGNLTAWLKILSRRNERGEPMNFKVIPTNQICLGQNGVGVTIKSAMDLWRTNFQARLDHENEANQAQ